MRSYLDHQDPARGILISRATDTILSEFPNECWVSIDGAACRTHSNFATIGDRDDDDDDDDYDEDGEGTLQLRFEFVRGT